MKTLASLLRPLTLGILVLATAVGGCSGDRLDGTESSVILSITDFDGLPIRASVNTLAQTGGLGIEEITLQNFPKNPQDVTSEVQSIELRSMEVVYSRADRGTRVPPPRVRTIFGLVPINGNLVLENMEILGLEQVLNPPLEDLLFENGGFDRETGSQLIVLDIRIRFFGRTLSGDEVASGFDSFTLELVP
jgi:hypothetical protein